MLSVLAHGEMGGIGELMALNLYLNNIYGTVLLHKIPVKNILSLEDFEIVKRQSRNDQNMILGKLYTFWDTWCSSADIVTQYRFKYANKPYEIVLDEIGKNVESTNELISSLHVPDNGVFLDFDPRKILLNDYVTDLISYKSMPDELLDDLQLKSFEGSFEFNPNVLLNKYHRSVFANIYTVFYWTTITHLKLGVRFIDEIERFGVEDFDMRFMIQFIEIVQPLTVFAKNQYEFTPRLPPKASMNIKKLIVLLRNLYGDLRETHSKMNEVFLIVRPEIQKYEKLLSADMKMVLNMEVPSHYYNNLGYNAALNLMKSNYQALARLVSATSGHKEDRMNLSKIKKFFYFLSEAIPFKEI